MQDLVNAEGHFILIREWVVGRDSDRKLRRPKLDPLREMEKIIHREFPCRDFGPESKTEHFGEAEILIDTQGAEFQFGGHHAFPIEGCRYKAALWKKLAKGESHVCVSGYEAGSEISSKSRPRYGFVYDRIKTKKGCDSWFDDKCRNEL